MKTVSDVNAAILNGNWSQAELSMLIKAINYKSKELQSRAVFSFRKGDKVSFNTRSGETITGTVARVNQKTVTVNTPNSQWKVSGTLLRKV